MLRAARDGGTVALTGPGQRRDWVHVDDVVDACLRALDADDLPGGTVLNVGTGVQTANEELVALAEEVTGRPVAHRARHPPRPVLGRRLLGLRPARRPRAARLGAGHRPARRPGPHLGGRRMTVRVVVPVYGNAATLPALVDRLAAALDGRDWTVRLVVDASPDDSAAVAARLAAADPRVRPQVLARNVGQHRALALGLAEEPDGTAWVCLDADLQDPPEAVPLLLDAARPAPRAVFAGRAGRTRRGCGCSPARAHRALLTRLTGLPPDAGAFLALDARARAVVLAAQAPSLVAALGAARLPVASVPVERAERPEGRSAWTTRARLRQSVRTLAWAARHR